MITTNGQLYQWDVGRTIEVHLLTGQSVDEIHIYNGTTDYALILDIWSNDNKTKTYARIPDSVLQSDNNVDIYAIIKNEYGKHTAKHINVPVITRTKPDDYVYTEEELKTYLKIEKRIEELASVGAILPEVTKKDVGKVLIVSSEGKWSADSLPTYDGEYSVTPKVNSQTMETEGKLMSDNLTINSIPYFDVKNQSGGNTIYIGEEV